MLFIKVLCDERFDPELTYQIDGEEVANRNNANPIYQCPCETCPEYGACQGWKREFNACDKQK